MTSQTQSGQSQAQYHPDAPGQRDAALLDSWHGTFLPFPKAGLQTKTSEAQPGPALAGMRAAVDSPPSGFTAQDGGKTMRQQLRDPNKKLPPEPTISGPPTSRGRPSIASTLPFLPLGLPLPTDPSS